MKHAIVSAHFLGSSEFQLAHDDNDLFDTTQSGHPIGHS